ncbi:hypothetical protein CDCA_CDCA08G2318 [Cyanidium caldarium]|uniref:DUF427 domain-containing protein n=1 Tax=Cyanidium caldarium TaxID=2771 RepID=A0AAV9IVI0_CYACA|nr:hypothetical protein CDCA_CDCA08G2318 [Cyanidium caldarium]
MLFVPSLSRALAHSSYSRLFDVKSAYSTPAGEFVCCRWHRARRVNRRRADGEGGGRRRSLGMSVDPTSKSILDDWKKEQQRKRDVSPEQRESVWDYPRPPRVEPNTRHVRVVHNGITVADTRRGYRVLETTHPPCYYIPVDDVDMQYVMLSRTKRQTYCEFKGPAVYFDVEVGWEFAEGAAWMYEFPTHPYRMLAEHVAFYASRVEECWVDDCRVRPEPGDFYGGWITDWIEWPPVKGGKAKGSGGDANAPK